MPAPVIIGTSTSFGISTIEAGAPMQIVSISSNLTSNKAEAKNINGGTAAVVFNAKKVEHTLEGYYTVQNTATVGDTVTPSNILATALTGNSFNVEEITITRTSEDFARIRYLIVQRDGIV